MPHWRSGALRNAIVAMGLTCLPVVPAGGQINAPPEFQVIQIAPALDRPVAMAFTGDGRMFVAQRDGVVKVIQNNAVVSTFIDLSAEVNNTVALGDRGMLALALDPNFLSNRRVYLFYAVDPIPGQPDEGSDVATFSRLTRYTGTAASNGNVADLASRTVLIGATPAQGFACCWRTHTTGALRFATDGSLLVSHGESALYGVVDGGGQTPPCFDELMNPAEDVGAFRAQMLDSHDGKILRIDPATGNGRAGNPFYNAGSPASPRSRVWVSGLRNPFRFAVRPGTGSASTPGTIYVSDVGWNTYEELSVSRTGGENMGWPCYEGFANNAAYSSINLPVWDCATINTPGNPGPLKPPLIALHHGNAMQSTPPGLIASCLIAGAFHSGDSYPSPWRGGLFMADFIGGWIEVVRTNANDQLTGIYGFGNGPGAGIVDFARDPVTGDICVLTMFDGIHRLHSLIGPGDVDRNGSVNVNDLLQIITHWGPCSNPLTCPSDLNVSGQVDVNDLLEVITHWG